VGSWEFLDGYQQLAGSIGFEKIPLKRTETGNAKSIRIRGVIHGVLFWQCDKNRFNSGAKFVRLVLTVNSGLSLMTPIFLTYKFSRVKTAVNG